MKKRKVAVFLLILICLVAVCLINHQLHLREESTVYQVIGNLVEVDGHQMNVYTEGTGSETLVFLSGGGTCSPVLDFRSLYRLLSDTYKIVVVEKSGYGFSEVSDCDRSIDHILYETRKALELSGISGPYILCPHSMSGIEALYWAQTYPEEVTAIIGLDMATPAAYEDYKINMPILKASAWAARIGITRWIPNVAESDAIKYGTLTEEEKEIYRAVFYRRTATESMLNEVSRIKENAKKVGENGVIDKPMLLFCSNGIGTGWNEQAWKKFQMDYAKSCTKAEVIELDCSHYIHDIAYEKIAAEIKSFLAAE